MACLGAGAQASTPALSKVRGRIDVWRKLLPPCDSTAPATLGELTSGECRAWEVWP